MFNKEQRLKIMLRLLCLCFISFSSFFVTIKDNLCIIVSKQDRQERRVAPVKYGHWSLRMYVLIGILCQRRKQYGAEFYRRKALSLIMVAGLFTKHHVLAFCDCRICWAFEIVELIRYIVQMGLRGRGNSCVIYVT